MNEPTPDHIVYAWHRNAMLGIRQPVYEDEPECGWFELRRKGEPNKAVVIWLHREIDERGKLASDEVQRCMVGDDFANPNDIWTWVAKRPISKEAYDAMRLRDAENELSMIRRPDEPRRAFDPRNSPVALPF